MGKNENTSKASQPATPPLEKLEIGGAIYTTRLTSKFVNRKLWMKPDQRKIVAIIPGTIQKIMVNEGDEVASGTPLLILEAMKMRNIVLSPFTGTVTKIHVSEGDMVPKSHLLVEMA
jgi:biotin carboxyl carrier protein